jgi:predicted NBD/HSP70 family sugar kinase
VLEDCVELASGLAVGAPITALGIAVCEVVDISGSVTSACSFDWHDIDVPGAFAHLAPAVVESDVRAAALAESAYRSGVTIAASSTSMPAAGSVPRWCWTELRTPAHVAMPS